MDMSIEIICGYVPESLWTTSQYYFSWCLSGTKPLPVAMFDKAFQYHMVSTGHKELTDCGLAMSYGIRNLGHHWFM